MSAVECAPVEVGVLLGLRGWWIVEVGGLGS